MAFSSFVTELNSLLGFIGGKLADVPTLYTYKSATMVSGYSSTTWGYRIPVADPSVYDFADLTQARFYFEGASSARTADDYSVDYGSHEIEYTIRFSSAVGGSGKMCAATPIDVQGSWTKL